MNQLDSNPNQNIESISTIPQNQTYNNFELGNIT